MTNPLICVDGVTREMTDAETAAFNAQQAANAAALVSPAGLLAYASNARYNQEVSGVNVTLSTGTLVPVSTARGNDRTMLIAEYALLTTGARTDGDVFKFADGVSRSVSNADMGLAIQAALAHVKAAFATESTVQAGINATPPTITTQAQIDSAFGG